MTTGKGCKNRRIPIHDERGVASVIALLVATLLYLMGVMFLSVSSTESTMASSRRTGLTAFYLADAGIEHARLSLQDKNLSEVLDGTTSVFDAGNTANLGGGSYAIQVSNNILANGFPMGTIPADPSASATVDSDDIVVVRSTGVFRNSTHVVEAVVGIPPPFFPPGVRGAVTTRWTTQTNGNITLDGRDHDLNGNLTGDPGTYGLFSADSYSQSGNSTVGGTDPDGDDYAPANPGDPAVIVEDYSDAMATTPDEVMGGSANGYPEGTLKSIAQAGTNGSQYVTNPSNLSYPLSGVTYVELACGDEWLAADIDGSGILVVHNTCTDAVIKNLNTGTFKGLLIADDVVHIHTTIIGAVVSLTAGSSSVETIGNGSGQVLYSRQAITNAVGGVATDSSYSVLAWYEL